MKGRIEFNFSIEEAMILARYLKLASSPRLHTIADNLRTEVARHDSIYGNLQPLEAKIGREYHRRKKDHE